jgi:cytochrome c553
MGCVGCHGEGGNSRVPQMERFPMLAGLKEEYVAAQLKAFRAGKRGGLIMPAIAKALKDDEIANLAAYLSVQKAPGG